MTITMTVKGGKELVVVMATWKKKKLTTDNKRGKNVLYI
jgi:hypothetical protein